MRYIIPFFALAATTVLPAADIEPSLTVRGQATISQPADQLSISLAVVSQAENAREALAENSKQMNLLIEALGNVGLEEKDYRTGRFSISPIYSQRPKEAPHDWSPKITGFEVRNSLSVTTEKIDKAGNLIDAAAKAGANSIDNIQFQMSNPQQYRDELIQSAAKNALEDARSLSEATGVKLMKIVQISIDEPQIAAPRQFMMKSMAAESTPIMAGDVDMSASVTIMYRID